ncbi:MAG: hypothetical protein LC730_05625 [Acidobacteria bacterium]|nr:hypothetical protein [Acidobacteriota bacterium]MCA1608922.1 hypothetical protein [Acidobacteriota bacterium]
MIEQNEMLSTMRDVAERLNDLGINYMVTGSFAMGVYIPARTTFDIDVVLEINSTEAEKFEKRFMVDYYVNAASIVRAGEQRSMFNIINNSTLVKVDCIIKKDDRFEAEKFARRQSAEIAGVKFWVIAKEDLILSKLKWAVGSHSSRQFEDVGCLLETGIDDEFLSDSIERMELEEVWGAFCQWRTQTAK